MPPITQAQIVCKSNAMKRLVLSHVISSALHGFGVSPAVARQPAKQVGGATNAAPSTVEHMRVNHGGANVLVSEHKPVSRTPVLLGMFRKR